MKVKTIKELGVSIEDLYSEKAQINVHLSDRPYVFHVVLCDSRKIPDCKISSWGANLWTRTRAGLLSKKYSRIQDLQTAIKKEIFQKVDTTGTIQFSLSQKIHR
jgi:hypothetical protein